MILEIWQEPLMEKLHVSLGLLIVEESVSKVEWTLQSST